MLSNKKHFRDFYFPEVSEKEWNDFRWQSQNSIKTLDKLASFVEIEPHTFLKLKKYEGQLHFSVTPYYLSLINPKNNEDPIRKQCIPSPLEFENDEGSIDPLGEKEKMPVPGVIHKYPDRVLFLVTNICPVYCRHCFRRGDWERGKEFSHPAKIKVMVDYVKSKSSIREVIISGGDPLFLSDILIEFILKELRQINHLDVIRIASRVPVVLPQRITDNVGSILKKYSPLWFVTQFNHLNEITEESRCAVEKLLHSKVSVLNQTVLLKGVNDNEKIIEELFIKLLKIGVKPYYLFQCDPVKGVSHFRTSVFKGIEILEYLRGRVSGLAQPTFALDTEGGGKVPLLPNYVLSYKENSIIVRNYEGKIFEYQNPPQDKECKTPLLPFEDKVKSIN